MKIGVVSDTHGLFDPCLKDLLAGVGAILHAGDVGTHEVLDELEQIARVHAVRGNVDGVGLNLPPSLTLRFGDVQVELLHTLAVSQAELESWSDRALIKKMRRQRRESFLKSFGVDTRVVVFGHSHQPCLLILDHMLFFNPGSAGKRRFSVPRCCGLLEFSPEGAEATILPLESYNQVLPGKVWLRFGE